LVLSTVKANSSMNSVTYLEKETKKLVLKYKPNLDKWWFPKRAKFRKIFAKH
jgi:hypothetical protein